MMINMLFKRMICFYILLYCYFLCYIYIFNRNKYLILIFGDTYYINIIRNLYENIILKYNIQQFIVATMSLKAYLLYKLYSIPVAYIKYNTTNYIEYTNINSKYFVKKMHMRTYTLYYYIKKGQSLIHIDADTYYFINPFYLYKMRKETDIAFACDNPECSKYNTGYMYILNILLEL